MRLVTGVLAGAVLTTAIGVLIIIVLENAAGNSVSIRLGPYWGTYFPFIAPLLSLPVMAAFARKRKLFMIGAAIGGVFIASAAALFYWACMIKSACP